MFERVGYAIVMPLLILPALAGSAPVAKPPYTVPQATFHELFGVSEAQAPSLYGAMTDCLVKAHQDFNAAASGRSPPHAKMEGVFSDGGTSLWKGACYEMTIFQSLTSVGYAETCVTGMTIGPSLRLAGHGPRGQAAAITRSAFVPLGKCRKQN